MRTIIVLLSLSALFFLQSGCCDTSEDERYHALIQGDWVKDHDTKDHRPGMIVILDGPDRSVFSFQDSSCSVMYPYADFSRFTVQNKVLHIWKDKTYSRDKKPIHRRYKIISLQKDQLRLAPIGASDTLTFRKIKLKNHILPAAISFHSSVCYGSCPSISLDVDSSRNVRYFGGSFSEKEGGFKGSITDQDYRVLLRLIHQLPLKTLKEDYVANWTDDQTCTIAIRYNDKWKTCRIYGYDKEPIELRLLLQCFFQIAQKAKLSPDPVIKNDNFKAVRVARFKKEKFIQFLPPVVQEEP